MASSVTTPSNPTPSPQATPQPNPTLVVDTELRQDQQSGLQPKVVYAGDVWNGQPYVSVQQNSIAIYGSKPNGIVVTDKFGTTFSGPVSFSTMPDQIALGGGYWRLNPLLLSSIPSTTATPIPVLVPSTPQLLSASMDLSSAQSGMISQSDVAGS
jgi:hypothetical protein